MGELEGGIKFLWRLALHLSLQHEVRMNEMKILKETLKHLRQNGGLLGLSWVEFVRSLSQKRILFKDLRPLFGGTGDWARDDI